MRLALLSSFVLLPLAFACDDAPVQHSHEAVDVARIVAHEVMEGSKVGPQRADALSHYEQGDYAGFVERMEKVVQLSESDVDKYNLACGYGLTGQPERALPILAALAERGSTFSMEDDPDLASVRALPGYHELAATVAQREQAEEALEPVREMALEYYSAKDFATFVIIMEKVAKASNDDVDLYNLACGYALAGRPDEAIAALEQLAARGADFSAADDSDFDSLRTDPRFHAVLAKLEMASN